MNRETFYTLARGYRWSSEDRRLPPAGMSCEAVDQVCADAEDYWSWRYSTRYSERMDDLIRGVEWHWVLRKSPLATAMIDRGYGYIYDAETGKMSWRIGYGYSAAAGKMSWRLPTPARSEA